MHSHGRQVMLVLLTLWISETGCIASSNREKEREDETERRTRGEGSQGQGSGLLTESFAFSRRREKYDEVERRKIGSGNRRRRKLAFVCWRLDSPGSSFCQLPDPRAQTRHKLYVIHDFTDEILLKRGSQCSDLMVNDCRCL